MTRTILDLAKPKTTVFDLSNVLNPRVNDDLAKISFHIQYDNKPFNMTGYKMYFISADENMGYINIDGMVDKIETGDNVGNGDVTFTFPPNVFKKAGTFDSTKTMFVIENVNSNYIQSTINISLTVLENGIAKFNADVDQIGYDSKLEEIHNKYKDKAQNLIDELINQVKAVDNFSNVKKTAEQAKQVANDSIAQVNEVNNEITTARSRFSNLNDRLNNQDIKINAAETTINANANYNRLTEKDLSQDKMISNKADKDEIESRLNNQDEKISNKADKNEIERKLSQISLVPEAFDNVETLKSKYPNGKTGIFITVDTGHKWIYSNQAWVDAGAYQSTGIVDESVEFKKLAFNARSTANALYNPSGAAIDFINRKLFLKGRINGLGVNYINSGEFDLLPSVSFISSTKDGNLMVRETRDKILEEETYLGFIDVTKRGYSLAFNVANDYNVEFYSNHSLAYDGHKAVIPTIWEIKYNNIFIGVNSTKLSFDINEHTVILFDKYAFAKTGDFNNSISLSADLQQYVSGKDGGQFEWLGYVHPNGSVVSCINSGVDNRFNTIGSVAPMQIVSKDKASVDFDKKLIYFPKTWGINFEGINLHYDGNKEFTIPFSDKTAMFIYLNQSKLLEKTSLDASVFEIYPAAQNTPFLTYVGFIETTTKTYDLPLLGINSHDIKLGDVLTSLVGKKVTCIGDSITNGDTGAGYHIPTWADMLATKAGAKVTKVAKDGGCVATNPHSTIPNDDFESRSANITDQDFIFILGGINDFHWGLPLGSLGDKTKETFYGAVYNLIIETIKRNKIAKLYWITPLKQNKNVPTYVGDDIFTLSTNKDNHTQKDYVNAIKENCRAFGVQVLDAYNEINFLPKLQSTGENALTYDGLHPNENGQKMLGEWILSKL